MSRRTSVFWSAGLTAAALLKTWMLAMAGFFRDSTFFTPSTVPFNLAPDLNTWLKGVVEYMTIEIKFDPEAILFEVGGLSVPNSAAAFVFGALALALAIGLYLWAVASERWLDEFGALLLLYFVLGIVQHTLVLSRLENLASYGRMLLDNPSLTFLLLLIGLFGGLIINRRIFLPRVFWRAAGETLALGIFLLPKETAAWVAAFLDSIAQFGGTVRANVGAVLLWGLAGLGLAVTRLYRSDPAGKSA